MAAFCLCHLVAGSCGQLPSWIVSFTHFGANPVVSSGHSVSFCWRVRLIQTSPLLELPSLKIDSPSKGILLYLKGILEPILFIYFCSMFPFTHRVLTLITNFKQTIKHAIQETVISKHLFLNCCCCCYRCCGSLGREDLPPGISEQRWKGRKSVLYYIIADRFISFR